MTLMILKSMGGFPHWTLYLTLVFCFTVIPLYHPLQEYSKYRATIGMRLFDIYVRLKSDGQKRTSFWRLLLKNICYFVLFGGTALIPWLLYYGFGCVENDYQYFAFEQTDISKLSLTCQIHLLSAHFGNSAHALLFTLIVTWLVMTITIFRTKLHQGIHELIAGTIFVRGHLKPIPNYIWKA